MFTVLAVVSFVFLAMLFTDTLPNLTEVTQVESTASFSTN